MPNRNYSKEEIDKQSSLLITDVRNRLTELSGGDANMIKVLQLKLIKDLIYKDINWKRIGCSIVYLLISALIIIIWKDIIFYVNPLLTDYNLGRFLWCLSVSCFGFAILAFDLRHHPKTPFPVYYTYYPFLLAVISALVFSVCHLFDQTSGFVFYYLSAALCFTFSYLVDSFFEILKTAINRSAG